MEREYVDDNDEKHDGDLPERWELVTRRDGQHGTVLIFFSTQRPRDRLNKIITVGPTYEDGLAEAQRRMRLYDDVQTLYHRNRRHRTGWNS